MSLVNPVALPSAAGWRKPWPWIALIALWAAIALIRWEVIDSPPCWDYAMALWQEGIALNRASFPLREHLFHEPHWHEGGTACYRFTVMPTFIGLLYAIFGAPRDVFRAYHLLVFLAAAATGVLVYRRACQTWDRAGAGLCAGALLTGPLYSTQIDMLSLETFLALAVLAAVLLAGRGKILAAIAAAAAGVLVKNAGVFCLLGLLVAFAIWSVVSLLQSDWRGFRRMLVAAGVVLGVLAALFIAVTRIEAGHAEAFLGFRAAGLLLPLYWCPELVLLACLVGVLLRGRIAAEWQSAPVDDTRGPSFLRWAIDFHGDAPTLLLTAVLCGGVFLSNAFVQVPLARYLTMMVPLLYLSFALLAGADPTWKVRGRWVLAGLIVFNLLNWNGRLLPTAAATRQVDLVHERESSFLERSHEYLADHRANIAAMAALEKAWKDEAVLAGAPFASYLAIPELGYVGRAIPVYATTRFAPALGPVHDARDLPRGGPLDAIVVYSENPFYRYCSRVPVAAPGQLERIFDDQQPSPLIIFRTRQPLLPETERRPSIRPEGTR